MHVLSKLGFKNWEKGWHDIFFLRKMFWINNTFSNKRHGVVIILVFLDPSTTFQTLIWTGSSGFLLECWGWGDTYLSRCHSQPKSINEYLRTISRGEYLTNYRFWWQRGWEWGVNKFLWWNQVKFLQHSATKPMTGNLYFLNKLKN